MHEDDLYNLFEGKVSLFQWLKDFHNAEEYDNMASFNWWKIII